MSEKTKVKVARGFCSSIGDVYPGDVVELPRHEAVIETQKGRVRPSDEKLGRAPTIVTRADGGAGGGNGNGPKAGELSAYADAPAAFPKKDPTKTVPLASAVKQAFKDSGLSAEAWNAATDEIRKTAIDKIAAKISEG